MTPDFVCPLRLLWAAAAAALCLSTGAVADLPAEAVSATPAITAKNRAYVNDIAINYIADGKLHIVDTDTGNYLSVIGSGFGGQYTMNHAARELIIATGYNSRGQRGERTDVVEVWDADTLALKYEVVIPPKRLQGLTYEGLVRLSADGRWLFVQNATPATSVTVVDLPQKKVAGEIDTPGCFGIYVPGSRSDRFSTLCGEGNLATVVLDANGAEASRHSSDKLFDADKDAWFIQGEQDGDTYRFVSFLGNINSVNVGGDKAALGEVWPLVTAADKKKAWRPGGYQPLAVHAASGRLYVTMHSKGGEGSHKNPAEEIWGFDLKSKKRVVRIPGSSAIALEPSPDGKRLYAIDGMKAELLVIDLGAKPKVHSKTQIGANPIQIEAF